MSNSKPQKGSSFSNPVKTQIHPPTTKVKRHKDGTISLVKPRKGMK